MLFTMPTEIAFPFICDPQENVDISQFFHPAMLQDPWAELQSERDADASPTRE